MLHCLLCQELFYLEDLPGFSTAQIAFMIFITLSLVLTSAKIVCLIPWNEQLLIVFLYIYVLNQL